MGELCVIAAEEIRDAIVTTQLLPADSRQPVLNITPVNERSKAWGIGGWEGHCQRDILPATISYDPEKQYASIVAGFGESRTACFCFFFSLLANNYFSSLLRTSTLMYNFNLHLYDYESDRPSIGRSSREIRPVIKLSPVPG